MSAIVSRAALAAFSAVSLVALLSADVAAQTRVVPQYVGLPRPEVERRLIKGGFAAQWRSAGMAPYPQDRGRVAAQVPPAGNPLPSGAPVILFVYDDGAPGAQPAAPASGGAPAAPALPAAPVMADCSRWPGSSYDRVIGACRCPEGQWWGLHGDRCEPREKAAGDVCSSKWPGSIPAFTGEGTFHCTCPPEKPWNAEALECGASTHEVGAECQSRWPGTVAVLSPSGTDYECRCPMGMRWEESRSRCDASVAVEAGAGTAPAAGAAPGVAGPRERGDSSLSMPPPVEDENWDEAQPGRFEDGAGDRYGDAPRGSDRYRDARGDGGGDDRYGNAPDGGGGGDDQVPWPPPRPYEAEPASPGDHAPPPHDAAAEEEGPCAAILAEIRGRAGAGQRAQADALALRAATRGCDPKAIADAVATAPQQ
ncbi:MAG TPA: PASTA domain-containing protein [Candidatus Limnocylindrales bacterium]|nr:PASTA domain-containing protein [Candidatus Limnocylindrales bacterium]